jgi:hypothetical protein
MGVEEKPPLGDGGDEDPRGAERDSPHALHVGVLLRSVWSCEPLVDPLRREKVAEEGGDEGTAIVADDDERLELVCERELGREVREKVGVAVGRGLAVGMPHGVDAGVA